jgi:hypothetical protein
MSAPHRPGKVDAAPLTKDGAVEKAFSREMRRFVRRNAPKQESRACVAMQSERNKR